MIRVQPDEFVHKKPLDFYRRSSFWSPVTITWLFRKQNSFPLHLFVLYNESPIEAATAVVRRRIMD
jgi:hypothetical protein